MWWHLLEDSVLCGCYFEEITGQSFPRPHVNADQILKYQTPRTQVTSCSGVLSPKGPFLLL